MYFIILFYHFITTKFFWTSSQKLEFHIHQRHMEIEFSDEIKCYARRLIKSTHFMSPCKMMWWQTFSWKMWVMWIMRTRSQDPLCNFMITQLRTQLKSIHMKLWNVLWKVANKFKCKFKLPFSQNTSFLRLVLIHSTQYFKG